MNCKAAPTSVPTRRDRISEDEIDGLISKVIDNFSKAINCEFNKNERNLSLFYIIYSVLENLNPLQKYSWQKIYQNFFIIPGTTVEILIIEKA